MVVVVLDRIMLPDCWVFSYRGRDSASVAAVSWCTLGDFAGTGSDADTWRTDGRTRRVPERRRCRYRPLKNIGRRVSGGIGVRQGPGQRRYRGQTQTRRRVAQETGVNGKIIQRGTVYAVV